VTPLLKESLPMKVELILVLALVILAGCSQEGRYQLVSSPTIGFGAAIFRLDTKTGDVDMLVATASSEDTAERARRLRWNVVPVVRR